MNFEAIRSESSVFHVFPFKSEEKKGGIALKLVMWSQWRHTPFFNIIHGSNWIKWTLLIYFLFSVPNIVYLHNLCDTCIAACWWHMLIFFYLFLVFYKKWGGDSNLGFPHKEDQAISLSYKTFGRLPMLIVIQRCRHRLNLQVGKSIPWTETMLVQYKFCWS